MLEAERKSWIRYLGNGRYQSLIYDGPGDAPACTLASAEIALPESDDEP
jgi:hypothetical protein